MPVDLCCPIHRELLSPAPDGSLGGCRDGTVFPTIDGIPILLPDPAERARICETDWSSPQSDAISAVHFYNRTRDHDRYFREEMQADRAVLERWLPAAECSGPVLEIGSGKGAIQGLGGDYVASDYSFTALRRYINPVYQRVCANAENLPFPDSSFRFIFSITVLEHVPNADRAFEEIARVLKPGGVAYLIPAWHCVQYNCEGIPVRPYAELTLRQKYIKATLPLRRRRAVKAVATLPGRILRRTQWALTRKPMPLRFGRLKPDYQRFWLSDSDAASSLDSHEACLFFHARDYELLSPGPGTLRQLLAGHEPVVVRKRG